MRFALFYEIPVAKPWTKDSEHRAYKNTLEQALAGEEFGWDAFWTVEHHSRRVLALRTPGAVRASRAALSACVPATACA
jgi:alkanesulfonate monooxygenase SsuD/methylene tetrahydromethanopterin reductase-like flavin-dependent oxidoreductase (luciferase family)